MRYSLYIGNKNYSSWSMRPWILMKQAGIEFTEVKLRMDYRNPDSAFKRSMSAVSPTGKVPLLIDHEQGDLAVWDSLAICEYLAEQHPDKQLWPSDLVLRAKARSACAEMHSGFMALRSALTFNIEASLAKQGKLILRDQSNVVTDIERIFCLWSGLLSQSNGPLLCGEFSIIDAFYAPICARFRTYQIALPELVEQYVSRIEALPSVMAWQNDAKNEHDFLAVLEPYRLQADN
ncbi:glutathione S-transferase family protein [Entomomonas sp. E2T0]|uniref:glutathione S-transferase family protein n=1 Tax=Entomomonas sp. E2T0 TaxID=2930213 RepID=UPI0022282CCD|nr:glutathione S-transferase family protein [Entomomonas sp. E2T0]UYZ83977.1 glutathione S-transferase family protein [Entomomonas sp. E2T0]